MKLAVDGLVQYNPHLNTKYKWLISYLLSNFNSFLNEKELW